MMTRKIYMLFNELKFKEEIMNDLSRASLDLEIEHIHEAMAKLDPVSEEYSKLVSNAKELMKIANDDDKICLGAKVAELKSETEIEKVKEDSKWKKIGSIATVVAAGITSVTSVACYLILCIANKNRQQRSIYFEETGHAHTDRSDKFVQKESFPRL